jgi:hypothetical protein
MNAEIILRALRIAVMAMVLGCVLWGADYFCGGYEPKTQGWLLGAAAAVFLLGEAFFWKAIDKLSEVPHSEALTAAQSRRLLEVVNRLKKRLMDRWLMLLVLKAIAGASAAWLLNQTTPRGLQRPLWIFGVGALTISLPIALTFLRNWQQADAVKGQQLIDSKAKKERSDILSQIDKAPTDALKVAPKILDGYTTPVKVGKIKPKRDG